MTEEEKKIKRREAVRRYKLRHPERVKESAKKSAKKYQSKPEAKEKLRLKTAKWKKENPEKVKESAKKSKSRPEAKEKHRLKMAEWRKENPEKALEFARRSYEKNKHKFNATRKIQYQTDSTYKEKRLLQGINYRLSGRRKELYHTDPNKSQVLKDKWAKLKANESRLQKKRVYAKKYREEVLIEKEREQRKILSDKYIICVIKKQLDYKIKTSQIPKEIIELKKNNIKIKRETKKLTL
jgi:hypothetical protein